MPLSRHLAAKLIVFFTLGCGAIFLLISAYSYRYSKKVIEEDLDVSARHLVAATVNRVDTVLASVEKVPETLASLLETRDLDEGEVLALLRAAVSRNPDIYGSTVAFEPHAFRKGRKYFAPYYARGAAGLVFTQLGVPSYDYGARDWYRIPKELGRAQWTEPYFDEGGGNILMATYSVPFYRTAGGKKYLAGIVTADVSLEWLRKVVSSIRVLETGFGMLTSRSGTVITHPSDRMIMKETIFSIARAAGDHRLQEIGKGMTRGESGLAPVDKAFGRESWLCYAPVPSSGWTLSVVFPKEELYADIRRLASTAGLLAAAGILLLSLVIVFISRRITGPLRAMAAATEEMARGNLDVPIPGAKSHDEIGVLAASFSRMGESLKKYIRDLTEATAARQRIESDLSIAHDIQMSILPGALPERPEFRLHAVIEPAREVGGDFYDCFFIDETRLCFLIADVSGKGVPSALFMAVAKTLIKATARGPVSPGGILHAVNNELCRDNRTGMFVTIFLGILDTATGEVQYASGGHNPPLLLQEDGRADFLKVTPGLIVGAFADFDYTTDRVVLQRGEALFLYTDGVTEAMNPAHELFSEERLRNCLTAMAGMAPEELMGKLIEEVVFFAQGEPQSDDITVFSLKFLGGQ